MNKKADDFQFREQHDIFANCTLLFDFMCFAEIFSQPQYWCRRTAERGFAFNQHKWSRAYNQ